MIEGKAVCDKGFTSYDPIDLAHTCDVIWADDTMFISYYLAGGPGGLSPCMKVVRKEGGVFDRYRQHFDAVWNAKSTVSMEDYLLQREGPSETG